MKWSDIKAALEGDDEDAKASAYATIAAAFPEASDDEEKKDSDDGEETKKDSADDAEKKDSAADEKDEPKKDSKTASVVASQDAALSAALSRIAALEAKDEAAQRASVMASREMTKSLAASLSKLPLATVKDICASLPPKAKKDLAADSKVSATRGDNHASASPAAQSERDAMAIRMGTKKVEASIDHAGKSSTFGVLTADSAKRLLSTKKEVK